MKLFFLRPPRSTSLAGLPRSRFFHCVTLFSASRPPVARFETFLSADLPFRFPASCPPLCPTKPLILCVPPLLLPPAPFSCPFVFFIFLYIHRVLLAMIRTSSERGRKRSTLVRIHLRVTIIITVIIKIAIEIVIHSEHVIRSFHRLKR